jgi:CRP/FNR family cyclic AMP-dependent transcriptional regulator
MQEAELLAGVPLFSQVPEEHLQGLAGFLRRRRFADGETIFSEGDAGEAMYIVEAGRVKIGLTSPEGREVILALLGPRDFFGELSLLDGRPRSANAVARTACELLVLTRQDFLQCVAAQPQLALNSLSAISGRLRRTDQIIADAAFLDVRARLARLLIHLAGDDARTPAAGGVVLGPGMTQSDLADMLGATRESVNKWLRHFEQHGILHLGRGRLRIPDLDVLRREASR